MNESDNLSEHFDFFDDVTSSPTIIKQKNSKVSTGNNKKCSRFTVNMYCLFHCIIIDVVFILFCVVIDKNCMKSCIVIDQLVHVQVLEASVVDTEECCNIQSPISRLISC